MAIEANYHNKLGQKMFLPLAELCSYTGSVP